MTKTQSKNLIRAATLIGAVASLLFVPWTLVWTWVLPLPDTVQEQVNDAVRHGFDGIVVYVEQPGNPPACYSAGWHDRKAKTPADPKALFKIASISKLYVAVAITRLVAGNRLSLNDTLADHFPELAGRIENADKITLRAIVQHRSGIPSFTDAPGYWEDPPNSYGEKLKLALDLPASFDPDVAYEYSNTNFLLLSELINRTVGYSHHQYIKEEILQPLGLENTFGSIHQINMEKLMSGYYVGIEHDIKAVDYGSMIASAEDLGRFLRALNDGSLLDEKEQTVYSSIYAYEHTGLIPGYQSIAKYHKDMDSVVIQFTNTTNFNGYTWTLSEIVYNRTIRILRNQDR